ncbi:MAG: cytochrome P450 [Rhodospirillaceae bacterium]|jgi:cytochrome P450|nr:cytochrome P450 [Rhodospirillaceae bacterium]
MTSKRDSRKSKQAADWDPVCPEALSDPKSVHNELRQKCPVAFSGNWGGFYTLTKYEDIVNASHDSETFTATRQTVIPTSPRKGLPRLPLQADPPEHDFYRAGLNVFFKENKMREMESKLKILAQDLIEKLLLTENPFEFSDGFAAPFTQASLCLLVGLDLSEADRLGELSHRYVDAVQNEDTSTAGELSAQIDQFAIDLVADRKAQLRDPETDMVSGLMKMEIDGRKYTDREIAGIIRLGLIGGHVVPKNFLSSVAYHLSNDLSFQHRLREEPALMRPAIEELLRFYSPNQALVRRTTKEVKVRGRTIPDDSPVALLFLSANFDEEVFDEPEKFEPERAPNRHIAFGIGPHVCVGQSLARMQTRLTIDALLDNTSEFTLHDQPKWARWTEFGVSELYLDFTPCD